MFLVPAAVLAVFGVLIPDLFVEKYYHHFLGLSGPRISSFLDCLNFSTKAPRHCEKLSAGLPKTQHNIPEDKNTEVNM